MSIRTDTLKPSQRGIYIYPKTGVIKGCTHFLKV